VQAELPGALGLQGPAVWAAAPTRRRGPWVAPHDGEDHVWVPVPAAFSPTPAGVPLRGRRPQGARAARDLIAAAADPAGRRALRGCGPDAALLNAMSEAVLLEGPGGEVALVNTAFARLFGLPSPEAVLGAPCAAAAEAAAVQFADPAHFLASTQAAAREGLTSPQPLPMADGRVLERTTQRVPMGAAGEGRVWVYRDITHRARVESALREARAQAERLHTEKNELLASVSHELRTPLNAIIGMTELVLETRLSPEQEDLLRTVRGASAQLHHLLSELLDLSRVHALGQTTRRESFDLGLLLEELVEGFGPQATRIGLELLIEVGPEAGRLRSDPGRVRQIVTNLVQNALKFTPDGYVRVSTESVDGGCAVHVDDTGPGVPEAWRDRVFERFQQLHADNTVSRGSGLGLAISRALATALGGTLRLGPPPDRGSRFTLWLPGPIGAGAPAPLDGLRVGVGADEPALRSAVIAQLRSAGAEPVGLGHDGRAPDGGATPEVVVAVPRWAAVHSAALRASGSRVLALVRHGAQVDAAFHGHVRRPVTRDGLRRALRPPAPPRPAAVRAGRILVAEDEPTNRLVFEGFLKAAGYEVHLAEDGPRAVRLARELDVDLMLLDIQMPDLDGIAAARAIRAGRGRRVPMLAITAHATPAMREACADAGMVDFLVKPVRREDLTAAVARWIGRPAEPSPLILIAEDDPASQRLIQLRLQRLSDRPLELRLADNGLQAVELFRALRPGRVLIDVEMPLMSGLEAVQHMRAVEADDPGSPPARIVAVTGHTAPEVLADLRAGGFDAVITKPVLREALLELLNGGPGEGDTIDVLIDPDLVDLAPGYLAELRGALAIARARVLVDGPSGAADMAHRFKGTGRAYGFPELTERCAELELAVVADDLAAVHRLLDGIGRWADQVRPRGA